MRVILRKFATDRYTLVREVKLTNGAINTSFTEHETEMDALSWLNDRLETDQDLVRVVSAEYALEYPHYQV